ncbi:MAG: acyltransferase [Betaproteobacteria bacterium]|nr:MAG: acyltransferase [Betaproteobacteria bacterium]
MHDATRIDAVDGLRALAMSLVIAQHCGLMPCGWIGVWLFYVISGYVITRGFLGERDADSSTGERYRSFLWRRALRIVPVYLLYLGLNVLILWPRPEHAAAWRELPSLLGFVFNWQMIFAGSAWGPFGHLWTLSIEQQFYLVFPLLVLLLPARMQWRATVALVLAGPLLRWAWSSALPFDDAGQRAFAVYAASFCHADAFLLGSLIARSGARLPAAPRLWVPALGAAALYVGSYMLVNRNLGAQGIDVLRNVVSGVLTGQGREVLVYVAVDLLAAALLVQALRGGALARLFAWAPLAHVGRVSYGGYLFHALVLWCTAELIGGKVRDQALWLRLPLFAVVWAVTVLIASASFRWFETPVARWGRTLRVRRAVEVA